MPSLPKKPTGRPSSFTQEMADEICNAIKVNAHGWDVLLAHNPHWPALQTIYNWFDKYPRFMEQYARAKVVQTERLVNKMYDIIEESDPEHAAKTRLMIDTIKWKACKLVPKVYGDRSESKLDVNITKQVDAIEELI